MGAVAGELLVDQVVVAAQREELAAVDVRRDAHDRDGDVREIGLCERRVDDVVQRTRRPDAHVEAAADGVVGDAGDRVEQRAGHQAEDVAEVAEQGLDQQTRVGRDRAVGQDRVERVPDDGECVVDRRADADVVLLHRPGPRADDLEVLVGVGQVEHVEQLDVVEVDLGLLAADEDRRLTVTEALDRVAAFADRADLGRAGHADLDAEPEVVDERLVAVAVDERVVVGVDGDLVRAEPEVGGRRGPTPVGGGAGGQHGERAQARDGHSETSDSIVHCRFPSPGNMHSARNTADVP